MKSHKLFLICLVFCFSVGVSQSKITDKLFYIRTISCKSAFLITMIENGKTASFLTFDFDLKDTLNIRDNSYEKMVMSGYLYFLSSYSFSSLLTIGIKNGYFSDVRRAKQAFSDKTKNAISFNDCVIYKSNRLIIHRIENLCFQVFFIDGKTLDDFEPIESIKSNCFNNFYIRFATPVKRRV